MTALERKELLVHVHTCEASQVALVVKNPPTNARDIRRGLDPWVRKILWRRKWQPTPVESHGQNPKDRIPGESHGQRSLVGYIGSISSSNGLR